MTEQLPEVWEWDKENDSISANRPTAGERFEQTLPRGKAPFQLFSMGTPNGQKVAIMLEELKDLGIKEADYDLFLIDITEGDQFGSDFVEINPNSKIPALVDTSEDPEISVFESGSILLYLADKFDQFIPSTLELRTETLNWLFWQTGAGPYVGGGFGHFFRYAPEKIEYAINRYTMETKRHFDLLDKHLADRDFIIGDTYTIADIANWPWYGRLVRDELYDDAGQFLDVGSYTNVVNWANRIASRPAVQRALEADYQEI